MLGAVYFFILGKCKLKNQKCRGETANLKMQMKDRKCKLGNANLQLQMQISNANRKCKCKNEMQIEK